MFQGVPSKSAIQILPTLNCLVALEDNPPWVLTLDEVEIAYFERVQLSLKNFDLVFVYKDFDRPVEKIRSIPRNYLSTIQSYLKQVSLLHAISYMSSESEILYFVGPMNLQWPRILKTIKEDPKEFYEMGGWESVLGQDEEEEEEEQLESEFEAEEEEEEEASEEYESDEEEDEASQEEEEEEEEEEDEAPTWEELEEDARQADKKRYAREDMEEESPRKKKKKRDD